MTLITLTDPKQSHVKIAIDENDYTNLARYRALGYFDADEETVETKDEAETVADEEEKPKPRRRRRTVEK